MLLDDEPIVEPPVKKIARDTALVSNASAFKRVGGDGVAKLKALKFRRGQTAALPAEPPVASVRVSLAVVQTHVTPEHPTSPPPANRSVALENIESPQPPPPAPPRELEASATFSKSPTTPASSSPVATASSQVDGVVQPKKKMVQSTLASFFGKKSPSSS